MNILAIESSCDETAAAVLSGDPKNPDSTPVLLSNVVVSQIDIFKEYGGVIPEVAARSHLEVILPVIHKALSDANKTWDDIDAIAVTHTPGLLGSLLVGTLTARTLAILHKKPLYAVHHLKSHIYANWLESGIDLSSDTPRPTASGRSDGSPVTTGRAERSEDKSIPEFPLLSLVVSGGHTQIIYMPSHNSFKIIGTTLDDAVGECFDKVAKILGLPYPGGPSVSQAAKNGNSKRYHLPHPKVDGLNFSFSGLKTAVLRSVQAELNKPISFPSHELAPLLNEQQVADFAASFEQTAVDILLEKLSLAVKEHPGVKSIVIAGGVSANQKLRSESQRLFDEDRDFGVFFPDHHFSGDNAAMVGAACFYEIASGVQPTDPYSLDILPRSSIY